MADYILGQMGECLFDDPVMSCTMIKYQSVTTNSVRFQISIIDMVRVGYG